MLPGTAAAGPYRQIHWHLDEEQEEGRHYFGNKGWSLTLVSNEWLAGISRNGGDSRQHQCSRLTVAAAAAAVASTAATLSIGRLFVHENQLSTVALLPSKTGQQQYVSWMHSLAAAAAAWGLPDGDETVVAYSDSDGVAIAWL